MISTEMDSINLTFLYGLGAKLNAVVKMTEEADDTTFFVAALGAKSNVQAVFGAPYYLRVCRPAATEFTSSVDEFSNKWASQEQSDTDSRPFRRRILLPGRRL